MGLFQLPTSNKNSPRWDIATKDELPFTNPANIYFSLEDIDIG